MILINYTGLIFVFFSLFISGISAEDKVVLDEGPIRKDAGHIVGAIILWIIGLVFVFAGKRIVRFLCFVVGFFFFAFLSLLISGAIVDDERATNAQSIGIIVGAVIVGIIGGLLSWWLYKFGIFIMGFLAGFTIGGLIVQAIQALDDNFWASIGICIGCGIVIGILMLVFMNIMIIITTSFEGSQLFMVGVDLIANKGYATFTEVYQQTFAIRMTPALWGMLASSLVLTLIGIIFQYKAYPKGRYYDDKGARV
ncbi:hypothetical protein CONCODRAFT_70744 [Conidiobolus coronatus NRRL 28638]|uniref:Transmembrane protein 198 n=1 Tax=Conidiobolus coronatus (strain ATCC 28846 / CBS 209.66 / NRRL 28638) TaxID=796925 RepID=A0A137P5R7_CONC2|nr:hypothetical protein CONCODRAFT_70744 [Conidiobolus coronatus NRRL 28638]|eukprot:KXN70345.1 hypothetical protein CONCODRAFT_70744 [Conidiobolus coronatus NRRL 28638]